MSRPSLLGLLRRRHRGVLSPLLPPRCELWRHRVSSACHSSSDGGGDTNRAHASSPSPRRSFSGAGRSDSKWAETPFAARAFSALGVSKFTEEELHSAFIVADRDGDGLLSRSELRALVDTVSDGDKVEAQAFADRLWDYENEGRLSPGGGIDEAQFVRRTKELAQELDPRVKVMTAFFLCSGASIGVIMPVMPILVTALGISTAQFGFITGGFAGAKMLANVPSATLVDRFGSTNVLCVGTGVVSLSFVGVGLATSFEELLAARCCAGLGVAAFLTAATYALSTVSTPLNRAKTLAPPMAAFAAGTAVGPAVGGVLSSSLGASPTFFVTAAGFATLCVASRFVLGAAGAAPVVATSSSAGGGGSASSEKGRVLENGVLAQWRCLMADRRLSSLIWLNGSYWFVLAGSQFTLLPLALVGPGSFELGPGELGAVFSAMSAVSVLCTPLSAKLLDKLGTTPVLLPACVLVGGSMCAVPLLSQVGGLPALLGLVGLWTAGGAALAAGPTAMVTDITSTQDRSQALALLRTGGDVGMLGGSVASGAVATMLGNPEAMAVNGAVLLAVTAVAGTRLASAVRRAEAR